MSCKRILLAFLLLAFALQTWAGAIPTQNERLEVRASETERIKLLLNGQKIDAVLADGSRIKGRVKQVRDGTLVINVERSDGPVALSRGDQSVATDRFNTLEVSSYKGRKRGIFAAIFGAAGLALGLGISAMEIDSLGGEDSINGTGAAVIAATTAGGSAAGYALGRGMDKKLVTIVIVK